MPGVLGNVKIGNAKACLQEFADMLQVMTFQEGYLNKQYVNESNGTALGVVSLGVLPDQPFLRDTKNTVTILDGEIYSFGEVGQKNEDVAEACAKNDKSFFRGLRGDFSIVCFNAQKKKLYIVSDKFGLKPIYYSLCRQGLSFASEVKALLQMPGVAKKRNLQALSDFYRFGFVLGAKTLFENILLLPPASVLKYDLQLDQVEIEPYWELTEIFPAQDNSCAFDEKKVVENFSLAVARRLSSLDKVGISLSGGLDSRAILAAMGSKSRGTPSYTLGLPGCQDQILSAELSAIAGTKHDFLEIGPEDLGDFQTMAETLVCLSDGFYHPHESTEKIALDYFKKAPFKIVLRGHGGEIAKASLAYPVQVSPEVMQGTGCFNVVDYIYSRANLVARDITFPQLFSGKYINAIEEGARTSLNESLFPLNGRLKAADMCIFFYINEWIRRQVVASLSIFRTQLEIRLPYLDEDFLESLLQLPVSKRHSGEVHVQIVRSCMPELLKVKNSNTGSPLDAGKLRLFLTEKCNAILKRLSVSGFRHYTEFQQWQREQFRTSIENILFAEQTLDRGMYRRSGLRNVFDLHVSGKKNYAHFLGTAVGLELWHRNFIDV